MKIAAKQIGIIKLAAKQIGLADDDYRALLADLFGPKVTSSKQLTIEQANRLIDDLQRKGFKLEPKNPTVKAGAGKRPRSKAKNVVHLANPGELAKVAALAALIPWQVADGFERFLVKRCQVRSGQVRTAAEAYRAIEALKKYFENLMTKAHGPTWWLTQLDDPAVVRYSRAHCPADYADALAGKLKERGLW